LQHFLLRCDIAIGYTPPVHILELIAARPLLWGATAAYFLLLFGAAAMGRRRHARGAGKDLRSWAIGGGGMHPMVAGASLAAGIASTATFVINPGFVYVHGLSALLHLGVAATLGMAAGLLVVFRRFRALGAAGGAVTLPQWIGQRFGSPGLRVLFAALNMLGLAFVVLITGGLSLILQATLGIGNAASLAIVTVAVIGYVLAGGALANAYANTLQAAIMAIVALIIVASGLPLLGGAADRLSALDPNLLSPVNPSSPLFSGWFSVWAAGFLIGFALMCQPHVISTSLYVDSARAVRRTVLIGIGLCAVFAGVLLAGLYARLADIPPQAFLDPVTGAFRQDRVMSTYLVHTFSPPLLALVTIAILAAGMSTLSSLLVALASIAGNDLYRGAHPRAAGRVALVIMAVGGALLALHPPALLGIFGQLGVYGLVAASCAPIVLGSLLPRFGRGAATAAALTGPAVHFGLYAGGEPNPAVTAAVGLVASALVGVAVFSAACATRCATTTAPTS
jgi:SSS family solute:Na+ symporter/sodium/pantothenate symporter